jgi:uncharacterized protein YndB with AHSA1/START domain
MPTDAANTLQLTRRFKAPRERVFAAFASLDALKLWLGPGECGVVSGRMDFRVGGTYLLQMKTPMGDAELTGTYREITPPERLVYTWQWVDDGAPETVVTVDFIAAGGETELRLTHSGFASSDSSGRHEQGWTGSFDKLDGSLSAE